jgi:hypothetical protein
MIQSSDFPRLTPVNHRVTSPPDLEYNCIAWAAGDTTRWWQPGIYWPVPTPADDYGLGVLEQLFLSRGYADCSMDACLETGFEKVALYGGGLLYTHVARQLPTGKWTSKLGGAVDIEHNTPDDVAGGVYGEVAEIMKRPVANGP